MKALLKGSIAGVMGCCWLWAQAPQAPQRPVPEVRRGASRPVAAQVTGPLAGQSQTLMPDGRTLLLGGRAIAGVTAAASWREPGSAASAAPVPSSLRYARAWHTATLLPDATVLVLGGVDNQNALLEAE